MESSPSNGSDGRARSTRAASSQNPNTRSGPKAGRGNGDVAGAPRSRSRTAAKTPVALARTGTLPPFESYPAIAIEAVSPEIDGGRYPVKRVVGDTVQVTA